VNIGPGIAKDNATGNVNLANLYVGKDSVSNNQSSHVSLHDIDASTTTGYGLILADASDYVTADNVDVTSCTNKLSNSATGTHNIVRHCRGITPVGRLGPPAVASALSINFLNPYPYDVTVYIAGGTGVTVYIGAIATGMTAGAFRLAAGQTINLGAYSVAPTWTWFAGLNRLLRRALRVLLRANTGPLINRR